MRRRLEQADQTYHLEYRNPLWFDGHYWVRPMDDDLLNMTREELLVHLRAHIAAVLLGG